MYNILILARRRRRKLVFCVDILSRNASRRVIFAPAALLISKILRYFSKMTFWPYILRKSPKSSYILRSEGDPPTPRGGSTRTTKSQVFLRYKALCCDHFFRFLSLCSNFERFLIALGRLYRNLRSTVPGESFSNFATTRSTGSI